MCFCNHCSLQSVTGCCYVFFKGLYWLFILSLIETFNDFGVSMVTSSLFLCSSSLKELIKMMMDEVEEMILKNDWKEKHILLNFLVHFSVSDAPSSQQIKAMKLSELPCIACESWVNRHQESAALLCNSCIVLTVCVFLRVVAAAAYATRSCRLGHPRLIVSQSRCRWRLSRLVPPADTASARTQSSLHPRKWTCIRPKSNTTKHSTQGHASGRACGCTWQRSAKFSRLSYQTTGLLFD